ncbi:uncharacterized protein G2W53_041268 [Senna tora]|uniref:Uncharacterized protein n=1 Tax=Senna tora TaxID=362788 RepID=A0A834SJP8_9FABA|nr:uncharacterized protein G2W53_041268 [Senna tora]
MESDRGIWHRLVIYRVGEGAVVRERRVMETLLMAECFIHLPEFRLPLSFGCFVLAPFGMELGS